MMKTELDRRAMLRRCGVVAAAAAIGRVPSRVVLASRSPRISRGIVVGEPAAAKVGMRVLADGGNAVDAVVAAALAAAITAPNQVGIAGYGGCLTMALSGGTKVTSIDFNTAAPSAARSEMFQPGADGRVPGDMNTVGWLAAGVPGVLAGLELARARYGTRCLRELAGPAIALARDGVVVTNSLANSIAGSATLLDRDAGSRSIYFKDGRPLAAGDRLYNVALADVLSSMAECNSVDSFYRGDIARRIADAFARHAGLVTAGDLANYQAREVQPLELAVGGTQIFTAPLTAGGLTVLQALAALQALGWQTMPLDWRRTHALIEVLRLAWRDRLQLLGDPLHVEVPVHRLLSPEYAQESAAKIHAALAAGSALDHPIQSRPQAGTISLSAADEHGNMVALTFTHGDTFGAKVTIEELGLTLGHGMSRFDPRPDHPNAPGPCKRPLHNMCPTIALRDGHPVLALGARGGRRIPNAIAYVLAQFALAGRTMRDSVALPRLHTDGTMSVEFEKAWPADELAALSPIGYRAAIAPSATVSTVSFDPATGDIASAMR